MNSHSKIRIINILSYAFFVFLALFVCAPAFATATIDPAFSPVPTKPTSGTSSIYQIVQPDGKVIIWGAYFAANGLAKGQIARLNNDGSVDTSFTYCSCQGLSSITSVSLQSDGKLVVAGTNEFSQGQVSRANSDGSADSSYSRVFSGSAPPFGGGSATIWAVLPDDKVLVERYDSNQGFVDRTLYRLNTDGAIDSSFTTFNVGGGHLVQTYLIALVVAPDGKIYYGRNSGSISQSGYVTRRNADGTADTWEAPNLTSGGSTSGATVSGLSVTTDGSLYVSGAFDAVNGAARPRVARLFAAGNVDMGFSAPPFFSVSSSRITSDGKVMISASTGLGNANQLYRLNSDGSSDGTFSMDPAVVGVNNRFVLDSLNRPVFLGQFVGSSRFSRLNVNGSLDATFDPSTGSFGDIRAIARQADGKLIVAGTFNQMNTTSRPSFSRINADGTTDTTFDPGSGFSSLPTDIVIQADGKILAFGSFSSYNGTSVSGLIRINSNGSLDAGFAPIVTSLNAVSFQADGKLLIAGSFSTVNGDARSRVARLNLDGTTDLTFNANVSSGSVSAARQLADGKVIVGGSFTGVDGFNRSNFVRLNSNGTLDSVFNPNSPPSINKLYIQPDGKYLYISGSNSAIGRRNVDGTVDSTFAVPTITANSDVRIYTLALQSDGSIIVGGLFNSVNGISRNGLVRLSAVGTLDGLFFPRGVAGTVYVSVNDPVGTTVLGGDFWRIQTTVRAGLVRITPGAFARIQPFDYDGDGKADVSVFRASTNQWYILRSSDFGVTQTTFAIAGDVPVPADFDGDGITDIAIYRPASGDWWSLSTVNNQQINFRRTGMQAGDIPMPSDYDGDGRADYIVYRPSNGLWLRSSSASPAYFDRYFGQEGDKPVTGDFDGDGKSDVAVYRPSDGNWWWWSSLDGIQRATRWGIATDIPAPADYDGDGKTDFAVYRPLTGVWYIYNSATNTPLIGPFGLAEDKPVPADYDGDGKADIAVFRPSTGIWYLLRTTSGFTGLQFGISTDLPTQNVFLR